MAFGATFDKLEIGTGKAALREMPRNLFGQSPGIGARIEPSRTQEPDAVKLGSSRWQGKEEAKQGDDEDKACTFIRSPPGQPSGPCVQVLAAI
ncbi:MULTISPECIES: hypothetical protein [unclassified Bradyrhizobium]|uniref:hypothetical protein n=1 Tax=unclassified Bradyrhizobium TaxID=2631580 RepID=UPI001FFBD59F|nr:MULTISPECIES: hypothetical protein [unclassified Bradyrhizobium]